MDYVKHVRDILTGALPGLDPTDSQIRAIAEILRWNDECKAAEDRRSGKP